MMNIHPPLTPSAVWGDCLSWSCTTVSRVEPEIFVPPLPGASARRAEHAERDHALFFDGMEHRVPIGLGRDGAPLYANLEFLDGTRGAHVNISGISGVATKTSYATFLLYSLFHSDTHKSPLLSAQTRRAPWSLVGGSMIVAAPVLRSIFARWLPASDT